MSLNKVFNKYSLSILERIALVVPIPDILYLKIKYYLRMGKHLNLKHPRTYCEKIQWLKLYGRDKDTYKLVDKYLVKEIVASKIGKEHIIPTIGVWDKPEDIDFDTLPEKFVLKCNHNSGLGMYICKDKSKMDYDKVRSDLKLGMKQDFYIPSRDLCYKGIEHKIIAEQYMEDSKTKELRDYKFFCFHGVPKLLFIASGRSKGEHFVTFDFFDMSFNHLSITNGHPNAEIVPEIPQCFKEMKQLAEVLSEGFPHVRVDFYEVNGHVYFGEMTFSHWGGMMPFEPEEWDYTLGSWIKLPID